VSVPVTPVSHARPSAGRWENADDHFDVIFQDTDATGAVFHGAYMHFLELARNRWLARTAGSTGCARLEVWSMHVRFLHAARLHDRLSVSLRARRASAHELVILQRLTCDGRMLVEAHAQVACFDGAGQPCPGPISAQPFESARWLTSTVNTGTRWIAEYAERAFDREVDARGFLSVEGAVRIFERARTAAIHELLGASLQLDRMRVYEIQLERRAEIRVGEDLTVRTGPGASTVFRADVIHELCGSDGETALSATVGIVCVDDRAQLIPLPSEVRAAHTLAVNRSK
jgi:acyl-CoA thioester hydrolase